MLIIPRPSRVVRIISAISSAGSPKKAVRALLLKHQKLADYGADAGARDMAVDAGQFLRLVRNVGQHGLKVLQVEQQQPLVVGEAEGNVEYALLRIGQIEQPRQQQRPHFGDGGADRMAVFTEQIPQH